MGVLLPEANAVTRFSYLEYQAIMVCLALTMSLGLLVIELTMNRFQVLPLLFPGMFSIRERKFYFFDHMVDNGTVANRLRSQVKMLMRMTLLVVLSYLWQHCVMDTAQQVGTDFPVAQCAQKKDCFASEFHFMTLVRREYSPVDCNGPQEPFPSRVVVSCIRFVPPSASRWLMHLAIAHSITQLNLKAFELLVWVAGNAPRMRLLLGVIMVSTLAVCVGLFFGGLLSEFASSWLSFVTILGVPMFIHTVYQSAKVLEALYKEESARVQHSIESQLNEAFADFGPLDSQQIAPVRRAFEPAAPKVFGTVSTRARSLFRLPGRAIGFPHMLSRGQRRPANDKGDKGDLPADHVGSGSLTAEPTRVLNVRADSSPVWTTACAGPGGSAPADPAQRSGLAAALVDNPHSRRGLLEDDREAGVDTLCEGCVGCV